MAATQVLQGFIYRHRLFAKQALRFANRLLPAWAGRRLRGLAEQVAFRIVPDYQGDTLPPIFHYWSGRHVAPRLARIGLQRPEDLYLIESGRRARELRGPVSITSFGAGACGLELWLAASLRAQGIDAHIRCVDFNPALIRRGKASAEAMGLAGCMSFTVADCNRRHDYAGADVIVVNQFFHHVENLADFCADLQRALKPDGILLTADMVGRNGHLPWPSVDAMVQAHWQELDGRQTFDRYFNAQRSRYAPVNHAAYSNEGVCAQDIVSCLGNSFDFSTFITFGGAIMPFVERRIGFNFDPERGADRAFINRVAERDDEALARGDYPGSNMVAVLRHKGTVESPTFDPVSPEQHVRMTARELARVSGNGA